MYLNDVFAVPPHWQACPPCRCPAAGRTGLPLGLQIVGKAFDEQGVLNAGLAIEDLQLRQDLRRGREKWW
jgi:aspartyl-tRNA(Asn)/glutamyl-tRNA(Gln) amidotransferase subunit A